MENAIELQVISVNKQELHTNKNANLREATVVETDLLVLQKLILIPDTYDLRGICVEIPSFASKLEVNNFCLSMLLLVENYENLKHISICTNSSETLDDDIMENYRNDAFSLLSQGIFRTKPRVVFTDCLNCSNDIDKRSIRLMFADKQKLLRWNINFSDLKYKRHIAEVFPKLTRNG